VFEAASIRVEPDDPKLIAAIERLLQSQ